MDPEAKEAGGRDDAIPRPKYVPVSRGFPSPVAKTRSRSSYAAPASRRASAWARRYVAIADVWPASALIDDGLN
jgi:hypothetical protein